MTELRRTMDFLESQKTARRKTVLILFYYLLTFPVITFIIYLGVTLMIILGYKDVTRFWNGPLFWGIGAVVSMIIVTGTAYHVIALYRLGGEAVSRMLGAVPVPPNSIDLQERKFLNVLEELSIASGVPMPRGFVLREEAGINAFAAGLSHDQAVVTVTQGALAQLTREELQGVIAHEFSHILNGDMALNARLLGIIGGISIISLAGSSLMNAIPKDPKDRKATGYIRSTLFIEGTILFAAGWIGALFGQIIRSAVSRQREFLADASAVQFTRDPAGIVNALRKIMTNESGSRITNSKAVEASHFFFANGLTGLFKFWFATHPPITERIRRIDPEATLEPQRAAGPPDGERLPTKSAAPPAAAATARHDTTTINLTPALFTRSIGTLQQGHIDQAGRIIAAMPAEVRTAATEPYAARMVVYCLLIDNDALVREKQMAGLQEGLDAAELQQVRKLLPFIAALGSEVRFAIIDITLPALRNLSVRQYQQFRETVAMLVAADNALGFFEYALQWSLISRLDRAFNLAPPAKVRYRNIYDLEMECFEVVSYLAWIGSNDADAAQRALDRGSRELGPKNAWKIQEKKTVPTELDRTLKKFGEASPEAKQKVLQACVAAIAADGRITLAEASLLRAIAGALDCPVPPVISTIEQV